MRKTKRQVEEILRAAFTERMIEAETPSLANPALLNHTIYMFAVEHLDMFVEWVNEDLDTEDDRVPVRVIKDRLAQLHKMLDVSLMISPVKIHRPSSWPEQV